jgi:hypothetical protein
MIDHSYNKVISYLIKSDFTGYDPYDGASSKLKWVNGNKYTRILATYVNKFSPVNIRPFLKIPKSKQNQALAFIARAMMHKYEIYRGEIRKIAEHLITDSLFDEYGYHCWDAHGFPIQVRNGYKPVGITDIIGTEAIGLLFNELDIQEKDNTYREICISVSDFIQNELSVQWNNMHYYRYTPHTSRSNWCYNASIIAAVYVARIAKHYDVDYDERFIDNAIKDVISRQKRDGEWYYSLNLESGYEKKQIDFHQGFILDSLLEYMKMNGFDEPFLGSYIKGLEFYKKNNFSPTVRASTDIRKNGR